VFLEPPDKKSNIISKMAVSALDSRIFRNIFGTQEIRDVFTDEAYTKYMMETEAALARAEASVGAIPAEIGKTVTSAFDAVKIESVMLWTSDRAYC
jgi:3-carboxy-cis,cis-muconate cycloisomerase